MSTSQEYIPGTCNIGKQEMIKRRNGAIVAGISAVAVGVGLVILHTNPLWRFIVVLPLISFGIGMQQWYYKFCVGFGMKGVFNFGDLGNVTSVEQAEMLKADRAKARKMIITGVLFAIVVTVAFYFLPIK